MQNNAPFNSKKFFTSLFIVLALLLVLSRLLDQWLIPVLKAGLSAAVPFHNRRRPGLSAPLRGRPAGTSAGKAFKIKKHARSARVAAVTISVLLFLGAFTALLWGGLSPIFTATWPIWPAASPVSGQHR